MTTTERAYTSPIWYTPVLSRVEACAELRRSGPVLSRIEGPVLSRVEGPGK